MRSLTPEPTWTSRRFPLGRYVVTALLLVLNVEQVQVNNLVSFCIVLAALLPLALCSLDKTSVMLMTQFLPLGEWDLEDLVGFVTFLVLQ